MPIQARPRCRLQSACAAEAASCCRPRARRACSIVAQCRRHSGPTLEPRSKARLASVSERSYSACSKAISARSCRIAGSSGAISSAWSRARRRPGNCVRRWRRPHPRAGPALADRAAAAPPVHDRRRPWRRATTAASRCSVATLGTAGACGDVSARVPQALNASSEATRARRINGIVIGHPYFVGNPHRIPDNAIVLTAALIAAAPPGQVLRAALVLPSCPGRTSCASRRLRLLPPPVSSETGSITQAA